MNGQAVLAPDYGYTVPAGAGRRLGASGIINKIMIKVKLIPAMVAGQFQVRVCSRRSGG
jgi:hypothetical protein